MIHPNTTEGSKALICLGCLDAGNLLIQNSRIACKSCGYLILEEDYKRFFAVAQEVYQIGCVYRKIYEKEEREKGEINIRCSLYPPEGWMVWVTLTILGGVVGNLAYDLMKTAALSIYQRYSTMPRKAEMRIDNPEDFELIVEYIREYADGALSTSDEVKSALKEELIAHAIEMRTHLEFKDGYDPKQIAAIASSVYRHVLSEFGDKNLCTVREQKLPPIGENYRP